MLVERLRTLGVVDLDEVGEVARGEFLVARSYSALVESYGALRVVGLHETSEKIGSPALITSGYGTLTNSLRPFGIDLADEDSEIDGRSQVRLDQLPLVERDSRFDPLLHERLEVGGEVGVRFPEFICELEQQHRPIGVLRPDEREQLPCRIDRPCTDCHPVQHPRLVRIRPGEEAGEGEGGIEKIPPYQALFQQAHRMNLLIGSDAGSRPCGCLGLGNPIFHSGAVEAGRRLALLLDAQAVGIGHQGGLAAAPEPVGEG